MNLEQKLEGFAELGQQAKDAFPKLDNYLKRITEDTQQTIKQSSTMIRESLQQQQTTFDVLQQGFQQLKDDTETSSQNGRGESGK